jgi:hypothetical protein
MIAQKKARDCLKKIPKEFCSIAILPHFLLFLPPLCNEKLQKMHFGLCSSDVPLW